jgi:hypothetical protein
VQLLPQLLRLAAQRAQVGIHEVRQEDPHHGHPSRRIHRKVSGLEARVSIFEKEDPSGRRLNALVKAYQDETR